MQNIFTGVSWSIGGIVGANLLNSLPSVQSLVDKFLPKPNIVYVSDLECWSAYTKVEAYILQNFASQLRACHLRARHGTVDWTLDEAQFVKYFTDSYLGKEVRLKIVSNASSSNADLKTMVEDWMQLYERAENGERIIAVASWQLTTKDLKEYVAHISKFRKDAQETSMYIIKETQNQRERHLQWDELYVRTNKRLSNTIVSKNVETELLQDVHDFMRSEKDYNEKGIPYTKGFLLYGIPGSGKSSLLKAIAAEYELPIFIIDFDVVRTNAELTKMAKEMVEHTGTTPFILAMEDLDRSTLFEDRYGGGNNITVQCLLNVVDGLVESHGRLLFITANNPNKIRQRIPDGAFMRPGRIDKQIEIGPCDFDQLKRLLQHYYGHGHACIDSLEEHQMPEEPISPAEVQQLFQKYGNHGKADPQILIDKIIQPLAQENKNDYERVGKSRKIVQALGKSNKRGAILRRQLAKKKRELKEACAAFENKELHWLTLQRDMKLLQGQVNKKMTELKGWEGRNRALKQKQRALK